MATHYEILGISIKATESEIKKAYHEKAKIYHPDSLSGDAEKFKMINLAYETLSNPASRREYDLTIQVRDNKTRYVHYDIHNLNYEYYEKIFNFGMFYDIFKDFASYCKNQDKTEEEHDYYINKVKEFIYPERIEEFSKVVYFYLNNDDGIGILSKVIQIIEDIETFGVNIGCKTYNIIAHDEDRDEIRTIVSSFSKKGKIFFIKTRMRKDFENEKLMKYLISSFELNDKLEILHRKQTEKEDEDLKYRRRTI